MLEYHSRSCNISPTDNTFTVQNLVIPALICLVQDMYMYLIMSKCFGRQQDLGNMMDWAMGLCIHFGLVSAPTTHSTTPKTRNVSLIGYIYQLK